MEHKLDNFIDNLKTEAQDNLIKRLLGSKYIKKSELYQIEKVSKNKLVSKKEASIIINFLLAAIRFRRTFCEDTAKAKTALTNHSRNEYVPENRHRITELSDYFGHPLVGQISYEFPAYTQEAHFLYPYSFSKNERRYR